MTCVFFCRTPRWPTAFIALVLCAACRHTHENTENNDKKVLGLDTVIAFYGADLKSQTFKRNGDWKEWKERGGIVSKGITHGQFLGKNADEASDVLVNIDFGDNPMPLIDIDEFGWDYDGGIDQHTMNILKATHKKRPEMKIAVWQMRGPVAPRLSGVYRDTVALLIMETYYNLDDAWMIPFQLQTARLNGILDKSIVGLGLGAEAPHLGGWQWTRIAEELDQQIRLIRFVAPESPGLAFFGSWLKGDRAMRMTLDELDEICSRFREFSTDGSGLNPELQELGKIFTKRYKGPAIFGSSNFVLPYFHSGHDGGPWGKPQEPRVARVLMMNLGEQDSDGVQVRLRDPHKAVWAEGPVDIPAQTVVVAVLPVGEGKPFWGCGASTMDIDAPDGSEVFTFLSSHRHRKHAM